MAKFSSEYNVKVIVKLKDSTRRVVTIACNRLYKTQNNSVGMPSVMDIYSNRGLQIGNPATGEVNAVSITYTKKTISVTVINMATPDAFACWSHLQEIQIINVNFRVYTLIGNNVTGAYIYISVSQRILELVCKYKKLDKEIFPLALSLLFIQRLK